MWRTSCSSGVDGYDQMYTSMVMGGSCTDASLPSRSVRAMRDSNVPKFLVEDARLFNAIVSDLFPGVEVPVQV